MRQILQTGCLIAGILCLFYFITIVLYAGISEWFPVVWVLAGIGFLMLRYVMLYQTAHPAHPIRWLTTTLLLLILLGILVLIGIGSRVVSGMYARTWKDLDYVIVLGAQVKGTKPSRALRKRLDCALEYAADNPDTVFILSGGQGSDEEISEALCMFYYMEEKGMDPKRLIIEDASTSTLENLRFSAEFLDRKKDSIGILSNNFHICRALTLAEREGYVKICGIPAPSDIVMQPHYVLREICALLKEYAGRR